MRYLERPAPPDLAPFVECLWQLGDAHAAGPRPLERVVPDGCIEIIVHVGPAFRAWRNPAVRDPQPRAFVVGQLTRVLVLEPGPEIDTLGIRLRPAGARAILHVPLGELVDREVPLDDLMGAAGARFPADLMSRESSSERFRFAIGFLRARWASGRAPHPALTHAVAQVLGHRGRVRIDRLAKEVGWSVRQLERRFARDVGTSPKRLARVVRVNALLARLRDQPSPDWADLALDLGFADQSHLIREFREMAGASPADRKALEGGMAAFFTSATRLSAYFSG
jgi:AraC-like DNA-binding protein